MRIYSQIVLVLLFSLFFGPIGGFLSITGFLILNIRKFFYDRNRIKFVNYMKTVDIDKLGEDEYVRLGLKADKYGFCFTTLPSYRT